MRLNILKTIYLKEIRETFRERRTLMMMVGLPILLYPMLIIGLSRLQDAQDAETAKRVPIVSVWGEAPAPLVQALRDAKFDVRMGDGETAEVRGRLGRGDYRPLPSRAYDVKEEKANAKTVEADPLVAQARQPILDRKVDAIVVAYPDMPIAYEQNGQGNIAVLYDSVRVDSRDANERLVQALTKYREQLLSQREAAQGLRTGFTKGFSVASGNIAPRTRRVGFGLGLILPFMLIFTSMSGAMFAALDTTAGEKERNTMQTLLAAPLQASEMVAGKFLAVWTVAIVSAAANVISMSLTFQSISKQADGMTLSPDRFLLALLMLLPVTMMASALFMAVGAFARDMKDAQSYVTPMYMLLGLPSSASMLPGIELSIWNVFTPILNISLLVKALLVGETKPDLVFLTVISSMAYATLAVLLAARVFTREGVLVGGKDTWQGLFGLERNGAAIPNASGAITMFAIVLVAAFYGGLSMIHWPIPAMLLTTQYGFFLLPVIAVVIGLRFDWQRTLRLQVPDWRAMLGALLLGASTWVVASFISTKIVPIPEGFSKGLQKVLLLEGAHPSIWVLLFCIAITPAICEEVLFRGFIATGLRRLGLWPGLIVTALLFGLAHASIYRLLPTFIIGLVLGYAAWRSGSIITSMIIHAMNNGLLATMAFYPGTLKSWLGSSPMEQGLPLTWVAGAGVIMLAGLWLMQSMPRPEDDLPEAAAG